MEPGALDGKTKKLIAYAVANAIQEPYCIDSYASACTDAGVTPEELAEALNVAAVIRGGGTIAHWAQTMNTIARKADVRVVVIGAGPCGLAAALGAARRGLDVTVLERDEVGASLRRWGPTRLFSPLAMNVPPGAADHVALPPPDAIVTGAELVDRVLLPLAHSAPLAGRVLTGHAVIAVGRARTTRGDLHRHPIRTERPFALLAATPAGERMFGADAVLDASGVALPAWAGAGGIPALGERAAGEHVIRALGEVHARRAELADRRILLVGHGHSAANAMHVLAAIAAEAPATRVIWAVRSPNLRPCVEVA